MFALCAGVLVALCAVGATAPPATAAPGTAPSLPEVRTFALALGAPASARTTEALAAYDLVVLDGIDSATTRIKQLRAKGVIVLGYMSVGTVEEWRPWAASTRRFAMGPVAGWPRERWARVADAAYRRLLVRRVGPMILARGFDGLFLDNTDVGERHPTQAPGARAAVRSLSGLVHSRPGRYLMAQNAAGVLRPAARYLDAWNREEITTGSAVARASAAADIARMRAAGLLVTVTDYPASLSGAAAARAMSVACRLGAVPFTSNRALNRLPASPPVCPTSG